ncbi:hypothetical protein [Pseudomonas graminis]
MTLSLSAAYISPANTRLTPSDQTLVAQPLSDSAKEALASAAPAAIYHPSEDIKPVTAAPEAIDTWVGRSQSPQFPRYADIANGAQSALKASFSAFQSTLPPDLAGKKYGFTVEADGRLKVLDTAGQLSRSDTERLTDLLNASTGLKAAAVAYRNASIDLVDADSPWSGSYMGYYSLTKENFANTIDLAPLLKDTRTMAPNEFRDSVFINQLAYKGERATRESEAAMLERRAAQRFTAQA